MAKNEEQKGKFVTILSAERVDGDCTTITVEASGPENEQMYVNLYLQGGSPGGVGEKEAAYEMGIWTATFDEMDPEGSYQAEARQGTETDVADVLDCIDIDPPEVGARGSARRDITLKGTGPNNRTFDLELSQLTKTAQGWEKIEDDQPFDDVKCDGVMRRERREWSQPTDIADDCTWVRIRVKWPGDHPLYMKWKMLQV